MKRLGVTLLIIPVLLMVLTGCWNRRELNDLAIAVAVGIDKQDDQFKVTAQIVNPNEVAGKQRGGKGAPTTTYTETAGTLFEAFRKMTRKSPRRIYVSHLRMLVLGESLATDGINKVVDILSRDQEFRSDYFIVIAKGVPAEKTLRVYTIPQELIPANKMFKSLETADQAWAGVGKVTLDMLISDLLSEGKQPVLTGLMLTGKKDAKEIETQKNVESMKPISSLQFQGLAVFKEDKLKGWLNEYESRGYNFIQNKVKSTVRGVSCPGGKAVLETIRSNTKVKGKVTRGRPQITIEVRTEENIADVECEIDLLKPATVSELEHKSEEGIKDRMYAAIRKAQQYESDIFGFGDAIRRADPKQWRKIKSDWDQEFANLNVDIQVDVKIRRMGTTTQPIPLK